MKWRILWALFEARNKEFLRDYPTLAWNVFFPFVMILGLALVFVSGGHRLPGWA